MRALLPTSKEKPKSKQSPYKKASVLSKVLFLWLSELIKISKKTTWIQEYNYNLTKEEQADYYKEKIAKAFKKKKKIIPAVLSCFRLQIFIFLIMGSIVKALGFLAATTTAEFFNILTADNDFTDPKHLLNMIKFLAIGAILRLLSEILDSYFLYYASRISISIKGAVLSILQDKILRFSLMNSNDISEGFVTNLIQVDSEAMEQLMIAVYLVMSNLAVVLIVIIGMTFYVEISFITVLTSIVLFLIALHFFIFGIRDVIYRRYLKAKDHRMSFFKNVLDNIDFVKISGMENYYSREACEYREHELSYLKQDSLLQAIVIFATWVIYMALICVTIVYFTYYSLPQYSFSFFSLLKENLANMRSCISYVLGYANFFVTYRASIKRIDQFLNSEEIDREYVKSSEASQSDEAVLIKDGNFRWKYLEQRTKNGKKKNKVSTVDIELRKSLLEKQEDFKKKQHENSFRLRNLNLSIMRGEKIAVVGKSSSGKSSLLYSMLGEMIPLNPMEMVVNGKVSYLSQERWIIGDTIRENITLGKEYDEDLMQRSLDNSQMLEDMLSFEKGLDTVLGDSGDTVSGGQRARIALARCFYQE